MIGAKKTAAPTSQALWGYFHVPGVSVWGIGGQRDPDDEENDVKKLGQK